MPPSETSLKELLERIDGRIAWLWKNTVGHEQQWRTYEASLWRDEIAALLSQDQSDAKPDNLEAEM